jgi:hypothetical protein
VQNATVDMQKQVVVVVIAVCRMTLLPCQCYGCCDPCCGQDDAVALPMLRLLSLLLSIGAALASPILLLFFEHFY